MRSDLIVPAGIAALSAAVVSWALWFAFPPKVEVAQRVEIRRAVGALGGGIDPGAQQQKCPKGTGASTPPCSVSVSATINSQGICQLKVDYAVVHPRKNRALEWTVNGSVTSEESSPRTFYLMFHKTNGIQVLGNLAIGGDPGNSADKLIQGCARKTGDVTKFTCNTTNNPNQDNDQPGDKHTTKAMAYNIIVWYDAAPFIGGEPNAGTSNLCILDPVIVNRG